jgi:membrane-bound metal-dependent hydrolase YbcI (DUF457 family)
MRYLAAFFGVAPDLVGFTPLFVYLIFTGRIFTAFPKNIALNNWTVGFAQQAYNYTHSLVIFAVVFLLVAVIGMAYRYSKTKQFTWWVFWPMLGWVLHILIDIPSHKGFYDTPFLFPLSEARFTHGVPWSHPIFMLINYSLLIITYITLTFYQRRKYANKTE